MIDFGEYIHPGLVISDLTAETKEEAIEVLVKKIFEVCPERFGAVTKEGAYEAIVKREEIQATGLGQKMAFPHARIKGWGKFIIAMAIHDAGIDFQSQDKMPANFICLMISSPEEPYIILQAMSNIIRKMANKKDVLTFFKGLEPEDIVEDFRTDGEKPQRTIQAKDIMRPVKMIAALNDEIEGIVQTMHLNHLDVLPVVDENKKFCGEISCLNIFTHGLPDFFKQLHTISFVRDMDPFQKYFNLKGDLKVSDFFSRKYTAITEEATLVEIVFQLSTKGHTHLFVIRDGEVVGKIDRFSVLDNILFF